MSKKIRSEIAEILNTTFTPETFHPENIHQNRLTPPETHDPNTIRWWAEAESGRIASAIGMTMSDFIKRHNKGLTQKIFDNNLGWQFHDKNQTVI